MVILVFEDITDDDLCIFESTDSWIFDVWVFYPWFEVLNFLPYKKKAVKNLNLAKANISTRNFPELVEQLRKKLKIKDGGNHYLFFTTDLNDNKIVLITTKADW